MMIEKQNNETECSVKVFTLIGKQKITKLKVNDFFTHHSLTHIRSRATGYHLIHFIYQLVITLASYSTSDINNNLSKSPPVAFILTVDHPQAELSAFLRKYHSYFIFMEIGGVGDSYSSRSSNMVESSAI